MSLYLHETGPFSAPAVVFLHGGGVSGWMWQPQLERLPDYHCIVPDLPGHGRSAEEGPFSFPAAARWIAEVIDKHTQSGRATLVGLSLGGQLAVQMLSDYPQVVERALISGALARPMGGSGWLEALTRLYWPMRSVRTMVLANMRAAAIPDAYLPQMVEEVRRATVESFLQPVTASLQFRLPRSLAESEVPALVLVGEKERKESRQSARSLVLALPNARGFIAPSVGHTWNLQNPDLFTNTLRAWIEGTMLPVELVPLPSLPT
jgi:pimeloyl-ACP methyl ester carboxylesterase